MVTVFSNAWFARHQRPLLWMANSPLTRHALRDALLIDHGKPLVRLTPFHATWRERDGQLTTECHIARAFGYRLFTRIRPVWDALHWFDGHVANPYLPAFNLGFDTLTAYPDAYPETTTVDGNVTREDYDYHSWSDLRTGVGTGAETNGEVQTIFQITAMSGDPTAWTLLRRSIATWNTAGIGAGATVTAATISWYGVSKDDPLSCTPSLNIYPATPSHMNALVAADYQQTGGNTPTAQCDTAITYAGFNTSGYNTFTLNASGRANIAVAGISAFAMRNANYDAAGVAPSWADYDVYSYISAYFAEDATADHGRDPKLTITYTPAAGGSLGQVLASDDL